jgi:hypothetical protein
MAFTATQYLIKASSITSTTTATVGSYTVPAATRGMVIAVTVANTATGSAMNYADVSLYDGSTAYNISGAKAPIPPGGSIVAVGSEKHVLPTGGAIYVTAYATTGLNVVATIVEIT